MGKYITVDDLNRRFGEDNITTWSNKQNMSGAPDTAAIDEAIEYAESKVENEFRLGRYSIPFQPLDPVMKKWLVIFAAYDLYINRGVRDDQPNRLDELNQGAMNEMFKYKAGSARLTSGLSRTPRPTAPVNLPHGQHGGRRYGLHRGRI